MRAVTYHTSGELDQLELTDLPEPTAAADEVLVRVSHVSLNALDLLVLAGLPNVHHPFPMVPGGDVSGVLTHVGEGAKEQGWRRGDRVLVYPTHPRHGINGESALGGLSELMACHVSQLTRVPDTVSLRDAAALPTAYGAAAHMLFTVGRVSAGEVVMVLGAAGGVGSAVVQLAKTRGAVVVAAVNTTAKADYVRSLGADHVIDLSCEDLRERCTALFGRPRAIDPVTHLPGHTAANPPGVDVLVNFVGGPAWHSALRCVRAGGRILTCGALAGHLVELDLRYVWSLQLQILGATGWTVGEQQELLDLVAGGQLTPAIDTVVPLGEYRAAFRRIADRSARGKVLVDLTATSG
ncbi:zinc-binding alcohol dehydrogenase family protein [Streptomyces sp. NPDC059582]|uniref:quinone oxidoreductase family protein n=1 Tax=Streptomyces sp. NPDC059582 TaxID=3346875 RepID=UPI00368BC76D